jgi:hypothetical protein
MAGQWRAQRLTAHHVVDSYDPAIAKGNRWATADSERRDADVVIAGAKVGQAECRRRCDGGDERHPQVDGLGGEQE